MIGNSTFETEKLMKSLSLIAGNSNKAMAAITKKAAAGTVRRMIDKTPPSNGNATGKSAQNAGDAAIAEDVRKIYASPSYAYGTIPNKAAATAFWLTLKGKKKNIEEAQRILRENTADRRLKNTTVSRTLDPSLHKSARKRGEVRGGYSVKQVIDSKGNSGPIDKYIKTLQKFVGFWAAGWMDAVEKLGVKGVPKWIRRHAAIGKGTCSIPDAPADRYVITIRNKTGFGSLERFIPYALSGTRNGMIAEANKAKVKALAKAGLKK